MTSKTLKRGLLSNDAKIDKDTNRYETFPNDGIKVNAAKSLSKFHIISTLFLSILTFCSVIAMVFSILTYKNLKLGEVSENSIAMDGLRSNEELVKLFGRNRRMSDRKQGKKRKPNFFMFLADDFGFGDLASYGHPTQEWGPVDELSKYSMKFTQFYAEALCTPSRAQFLTGRLPARMGLSGGSNLVFNALSPGGLPDDEITISELLKNAGYVSGMNGKWHLGINCRTHNDGCHLPFRHGFDFLGTYFPFTNQMACDENQRYAAAPNTRGCFLYRGKMTTPWQQPAYRENLTAVQVSEIKEFITRNREKQWFYYFATPQIHNSVYASKRFQGSSKRGLIGDTINEMNWSVGEILKHLHNLKLAEDTLFIFSSDNGAPRVNCEEGGNNGLLRAGKGQHWEGGLRVPTFAYWPGTITAGQSEGVFTNADFFPTFAKLAGVQIPTDREIDGIDMTSVLLGDGKQSDTDFNKPRFWYCGHKLMSIRMGRYKIHYWTWNLLATNNCINGMPPFNAGLQVPKQWRTCSETEMTKQTSPLIFDLEADPSEQYPLNASDYQWIIDEASAAYEKHEKSINFDEIVDQLSFPYDPSIVPCCSSHRNQCVCNYPLSEKFNFTNA